MRTARTYADSVLDEIDALPLNSPSDLLVDAAGQLIFTHPGHPTRPRWHGGRSGHLYVAVFSEGVIRVFSADGLFLHDIDLYGGNPSNCAFDPSGELGLVITETKKGELLSVRL